MVAEVRGCVAEQVANSQPCYGFACRKPTSLTERGPELRTTIILTLTGADRVGIVEDVTAGLLSLGANVETGRMARLGGEFAILMQATLEESKLEGLAGIFAPLTDEGYRVTTSTCTTECTPGHAGWLPFRIEVEGADHEGIVHEVASRLAKLGISIESMETGTVSAPVSGTPLFTMSALVVVPPELTEAEWTSAVTDAGERSGVDITIIAE